MPPMRYDTTLKELLQSGTPQLWQALLGQQPREFLTVELPSVQMRRPDFLARFGEGAIFHLELQGENEKAMVWRELEYYSLIYRLFQQPPIQVVLYFGSAPLAMSNSLAFEALQFRYGLIDIRTINHNYLLADGSLADAVFAALAASEKTEHQLVTRTVVKRLSRLPTKEQRDWLEKLMIVSGIRGYEDIVREEAEKMGISLDIRDNKFFQEAYAAGIEDGMEKGMEKGIEKGIEKGMEKGMAKGEQALLQRQLERRFGPMPEWARQRVEAADPAALEQMGLRLLEAQRLEDVLDGQNG